MIQAKHITQQEVVNTYLLLLGQEVERRRQVYRESEYDGTLLSFYFFLKKQYMTEGEFVGDASVPLGHKLSKKYPWKVVARKLDKLEKYMDYRGGFGPLYGIVRFKDEYIEESLIAR